MNYAEAIRFLYNHAEHSATRGRCLAITFAIIALLAIAAIAAIAYYYYKPQTKEEVPKSIKSASSPVSRTNESGY